jgi:hypothetical protein
VRRRDRRPASGAEAAPGWPIWEPPCVPRAALRPAPNWRSGACSVSGVARSFSAVFLTGEAAATLAGAVAGPVLAQAAQLSGLAAVASITTLTAAALTYVHVPSVPASARQQSAIEGDPS